MQPMSNSSNAKPFQMHFLPANIQE